MDDNEYDCFEDRKYLKNKQYIRLKIKYDYNDNNFYNPRFLLSMLAVREVDDDWWDGPSSGSLSVNSYGQIKIEDLNNKFITIFAHPTKNKLDVVESIINKKKSIIGVEKNIRNDLDVAQLEQIINDNQLLMTIGSDSHDSSLKYYSDINYYKIDSKRILDILRRF